MSGMWADGAASAPGMLRRASSGRVPPGLFSKGLLLLLGLLLAGPAAAQELPAKLGLLVMLKVIRYDKHFPEGRKDDFVVLVAHDPAMSAGLSSVLGASEELKELSIDTRRLRFVPIPVGSAQELGAAAERLKASAVLAAPGVSSAGAESLAKAASQLKLYSLSLDTAHVEKGILLGVTVQDGRPQIVINLRAAKDIDANFDVTVLKRARVVR